MIKFSNTLFFAGTIALIAACGNQGGTNYGSSFESSNAVEFQTAYNAFEKSGSSDAIVTGTISKVCQSEGCWYSYQINGKEITVDFDHKFEIPKNSSGKTAIAKGSFVRDTTSVEQLQEWAKDDGASDSAIKAITEPEVQVIFKATGVIIK